MAADDQIGPGEILRWLERLDKGQEGLSKKIDGLSFVRYDVWEQGNASMRERIDTVEAVVKAEVDEVRKDLGGTQSNLRWLGRLVAGIVIATLVGAMLAGVMRT